MDQSDIPKKKFGGNICVEIPIDDLRKDDYIMYWDNGYRVGKVFKNHRGYKHRWIKLYPLVRKGYVLQRSKKITPKVVRSAWRRVDES